MPLVTEEEEARIPEALAAAIFGIAVHDRKAADLFACLTSGGAATIDPSGVLILIPRAALDAMFEDAMEGATVTLTQPDGTVETERLTENGYIVSLGPRRYIAHEAHYPGTGTTVVTIRTHHDNDTKPPAQVVTLDGAGIDASQPKETIAP